MILSEKYRELPEDISDDELDDAIDDAVAAARLIEDDPHILFDDFMTHLEKIYPVWIRDAGAWSQLLTVSEFDQGTIALIHRECCNIFDSSHDDRVTEPWEMLSEAV